MNKKYVYALAAIVILAAIWLLLGGSQSQDEALLPSSQPSQSPNPSSQAAVPNSALQADLQQELDAAGTVDIDAELKQVDQDIQGL